VQFLLRDNQKYGTLSVEWENKRGVVTVGFYILALPLNTKSPA